MAFSNPIKQFGFAVLVCHLFLISTASSQVTYSITDSRDSQPYRVVRIGAQWWMAENLNIGIRIPAADSMTNNDMIEKYCFNDSEDQCDIYGGLYPWEEQMNYFISGTNTGICPVGWHVPTDAEWKEMELAVGMSPEAVDSTDWRGTNEGGRLKSVDPLYWQEPNACATDEFGFSLLPAGFVTSTGYSTDQKHGAFFYCADMNINLLPWMRWFSANECRIFRNDAVKTEAQSVRCLKDSPFVLERGTMIDPRDEKVYQTVLIGNHWWMAENLNHGIWIDLIGPQTDNEIIQKYCYNNRGEYCDNFGGLYRWEEMMNYNPENSQGICPEGWHIPSDNDWKELEFAAGMMEADLDKPGEERVPSTGVFLQGGEGSGFEVLPGGMIDPHGNSVLVDTQALFWTSDQLDTKYSWSRVFQNGLPNIHRNNKNNQYDALSVRCVSNNNEVLSLLLEAPDTVCAGQEFTMKAVVSGGTATKTFSWTSDPPGFLSTDSIVKVKADADTRYQVRVIDGYIYTQHAVKVHVKPIPVFNIAGEKQVCATSENMPYAVTENPSYHYLWSHEGGKGMTGADQSLVMVNWGENPGIRRLFVQVDDFSTGCFDREIMEVEIMPVPPKPYIVRKGDHLLICPDSGRIYQWYRNEDSIPGANKQFYYAKGNNSGIFKVETKLENQCTNRSDPFSFLSKSAGEADEAFQNVFIRPNPAGRNIIMDMINDYTGELRIAISNSAGKVVKQYTLVKTGQVFENALSLEGMPEGLYIVLVRFGAGKEVHRLVIQQ